MNPGGAVGCCSGKRCASGLSSEGKTEDWPELIVTLTSTEVKKGKVVLERARTTVSRH